MKFLPNLLHVLVLFFTVGSIVSCKTGQTERNDIETVGYKVEYSGALKNMMHKGDVAAKADLKDLEAKEHLYALGALENLKGEIQIFDSKPFNTTIADSSLLVDQSFDKKATLLVYASVSKWKSIAIPDTIVSYAQLETFIAHNAAANQLRMDEPFPFLIEGKAASFDWHVINWKDGDMEHSHEKHIRSGLYGTEEQRAVELLGFYSDSHHAIFTHHTTNMHIHVKTSDDKIAGHVDELTLGKGMVLKLPEVI